MKKLGEDVRLRFLSIAIAIILWICIVNIQNPELKKEFDDIPVSIEGTDVLANYDLIPVEDKVYSVLVKVKGSQEAVEKIDKKDIEAVADLKDVRNYIHQGMVPVPVTVTVNGADGVQILDKDKYIIKIQLDKYSQVQKMVEVAFQGVRKKDANYEIKSVRPNVVTISGPQALVKKIDSAKVFVDVTNQDKDISVIKKYKIFNYKNEDITNNEQLIKDSQNIQVDINYSKVKEVQVAPNIQGVPVDGYYISGIKVKPDKVLVSGSTEQVDQIEKIKLQKLNVSGRSKSFKESLRLLTPEGIKANFAGNIEMSINIEKEVRKELLIPKANISIANTSADYLYDIGASDINVYLTGKKEALDKLTLSSLGLSVNVAGLKQGEYYLPVFIAPTDNYKIQNQPPKIKVNITPKSNS